MVITMGEPAGSGADILLQTMVRHGRNLPPLLVIDDPDRLRSAAAGLNLDLRITTIEHVTQAAEAPGLAILPVSQAVPYAPGHPTADTAPAVIEALDTAIELCLSGEASAMVTLPIQKDILYQAGFTAPGHTEYLATKSKTPKSVMMLATEELRVVPVTIHQALDTVSSSLTRDLIMETARITHQDLQQKFGMPNPRLTVTGLNPHAGENGSMGREEIEIITPAVDHLKAEGLNITGPAPADTLFHAEARSTYDAVLCMYHDQALIPLKTLDFWGGVNITLGLPFIRTSPDHGTANALAGTGQARIESFVAALHMAQKMSDMRTQYA